MKLSRKEPGRWKEWKEEWREMLPDIEVEVTVNSSVETPGLFGKSTGIGSDY